MCIRARCTRPAGGSLRTWWGEDRRRPLGPDRPASRRRDPVADPGRAERAAAHGRGGGPVRPRLLSAPPLRKSHRARPLRLGGRDGAAPAQPPPSGTPAPRHGLAGGLVGGGGGKRPGPALPACPGPRPAVSPRRRRPAARGRSGGGRGPDRGGRLRLLRKGRRGRRRLRWKTISPGCETRSSRPTASSSS